MTIDPEREYAETGKVGGLVIDPDQCAYCAAWPGVPCALHHRAGDE